MKLDVDLQNLPYKERYTSIVEVHHLGRTVQTGRGMRTRETSLVLRMMDIGGLVKCHKA